MLEKNHIFPIIFFGGEQVVEAVADAVSQDVGLATVTKAVRQWHAREGPCNVATTNATFTMQQTPLHHRSAELS